MTPCRLTPASCTTVAPHAQYGLRYAVLPSWPQATAVAYHRGMYRWLTSATCPPRIRGTSVFRRGVFSC